jgi:hypothetical protein
VVLFSSAEVMGADPVWLGDRHQGSKGNLFITLNISGGSVQRDRRVVTRMSSPSRALSDGAGGTLQGPPA